MKQAVGRSSGAGVGQVLGHGRVQAQKLPSPKPPSLQAQQAISGPGPAHARSAWRGGEGNGGNFVPL